MVSAKESNTSVMSGIKSFIPAKSDSVKLLLTVIFLSMVFLPLIRMFINMDAESIGSALNSHNFGTSVINSAVSSVIATVITVVLAFAAAFLTERTNIRMRSVWGIIFTLPMLIPSISIGMGMIILFGNNGIFTELLGIEGNIYGMSGVVIGAVLYAFPVAYLMLSDIIRYEDSSPYEAAQVLGLSKFQQFRAITLPYLRKPLISVVFSIFTLVVTDYGVVLMVGGKYTTIPMVMYQEVIGQLDFGKGSVYGSLLLIPAVAAFVIDLVNKDRGNSAFVIKPHVPSDKPLHKLITYVCCVLISVFILLPLVSFIILAFSADYPNNIAFSLNNFIKAEKLHTFDYLGNSIVIALLTSVIGVFIAFVTAYLSSRMKSRLSRFLHLSSMTSAAIPGIVLGLAYVLMFKGTSIYGTIIILVMVNVVHFISSPYLMIYNSLSKINENLESVAQTLGISRVYMIKDVFIPQCRGTILEMFSYFFVNCMMTISAVSFLATTSNKPVSLMINQFEAQMQLECAAVVSIMILAANLIVKAVVYAVKCRSQK